MTLLMAPILKWMPIHLRDTRNPYIDTTLCKAQSIRVLQLYPGKAGSPLHCSLLEASLDRVPKYEAVSYTWGSLETNDEIECDSKTIFITKNCSKALRRLRHAENSRLLWIDSICIDQQSTLERNHRVNMMGRVYSKADQVIVWLGEGNEQTDGALN